MNLVQMIEGEVGVVNNLVGLKLFWKVVGIEIGEIALQEKPSEKDKFGEKGAFKFHWWPSWLHERHFLRVELLP